MKTDARMYARIVVGISSLLITIGLLFVYSASSMYALAINGSAHYYVIRQLTGILIGSIAGLSLRYIPVSIVRVCSPLAYGLSLLLTAMTLLPKYAVRIHGSNRWLNLYGFSFQPSELLKITFILCIAYVLEKKKALKNANFLDYLIFLLLLGTASILLLAQPDFGLTVTLAITTLALLIVAGIGWRYIVLTSCAALPVCAFLVMYKPYRLQRILTFLNPWADPQGAGFQIIQSLIAIGSGGWYGVGIGSSKQKFFYLPMQHTDFIFAIIAEEIGFIGITCLSALFIALFYAGIKLASKLNNTFDRLTTFGFIFLVTLQTLMNIAVTTGIAPTKGIGLPFISYGNSALVCSIAMLGLLVNMAHNNPSQSEKILKR